MNLNNLKMLIKKIYNEGLFVYKNDQEKSEEIIKLEEITGYKDVNELFFSDLAPDYVYDTVVLYKNITSKNINEDEYIGMIDKLIDKLDDIKEYELDLYCKLLGEHLGINANEVFDDIFELSEENFTAKEIYNKLKK
ncbi:hypothetical protein [uncultured Clostridium sp.]|uniref:hypothetical protein n=1 Tax=uncultured Clostridium sp. TaxID=59620 RepID=UPI0025F32A91|nr:hypothetical protein [uncultured Clostridium sp.]